MKWVQIIPEAYCCVHHSHVYVSVPETAEEREEFRLGMGSNTREIDLIEYAMGSTGQYYPDGTGRKLPAGGLFRFAPHYHPWGEETIDRQKVGIKFYPKGQAPELIVTAHRIRTGVGNDWKLNREAVEDRLLMAGYDLDLHAERMPTGALIDDNTLNGVALMSIPPNTVARHERFWPLPQAALILSFQPHMHFRGNRMLLEAIHVDGRREILTDVTNYEQTWQIVYAYEKPHAFPKGTILHTVSWHDNTANNRHNPDPSAWIGWGVADHGRDGPRLDGRRVHDRRAVRALSRGRDAAARRDRRRRRVGVGAAERRRLPAGLVGRAAAPRGGGVRANRDAGRDLPLRAVRPDRRGTGLPLFRCIREPRRRDRPERWTAAHSSWSPVSREDS